MKKNIKKTLGTYYFYARHSKIFQDPISLKVDWTFLSHDYVIGSKKFVQINENKALISGPLLGKILTNIVFLLLICTIIFCISTYFIFELVSELKLLLVFPILIFFIFSLYFLERNLYFILFDKEKNVCEIHTRSAKKKFQKIVEKIDLKEVHAIQLIQVILFPPKSLPILRYQLNLILHSTHRTFLFNSSNSKILRSRAKSISNFLNIPIWDAITHQDGLFFPKFEPGKENHVTN